MNGVSLLAPNINQTRQIIDDTVVSKEDLELSVDLFANEILQPQRRRNTNSRAQSKYFKDNEMISFALA